MSSGLPRGWAECTLAEVGEVVTGNTPPKNNTANYGKKYPWVKPPDLGSDAPITKTGESLSAEGARLARLLPSETTLVSCIGILGKVGYAGTTLATNQQINSVVFDRTLVEPRYGFQYCKTLREWMDQNSSSTTVTIINKGRFSQAPFLLPPLPEQRRIVAKLEKLLDKVDTCQQRLAKIPVILKRFRQSVLAAACTGRLTADWREDNPNSLLSSQLPDANRDLPSSWIWKKIRDLAESAKGSIQSGPFGSNLLHSEFQPTGILAIGIDNVLDGKFNLGRQHRIAPQKYEVLKKYTARPLDVLVTVMATVGRCCVVPGDIETAIITKHVYRITTNQRSVNPYYLMQCIRGCPFVLSQVETEIQGATRPGINGSILKEINIPLPTLPEQREIVRRVEDLFSLADQIEARYAKAKGQVDQITQSLLAKAFRGELVPQNPNDEPASVLLEQIKTERTKREMEIKGHEVGKRKATKERMKKRY
jgi:type I restriction enzyme S subunit